MNYMKKKFTTPGLCLVFSILLAACAINQEDFVLAPDTKPGDQLKDEYLRGIWCTNRELTAQTNKDAGNSALTNLSPVFWKFDSEGKWKDAESGWIFLSIGTWQLQGRDSFILDPESGKPTTYQARFESTGADLYLLDEEGQSLVLTRCD